MYVFFTFGRAADHDHIYILTHVVLSTLLHKGVIKVRHVQLMVQMLAKVAAFFPFHANGVEEHES